jgi:hypothetical protein
LTCTGHSKQNWQRNSRKIQLPETCLLVSKELLSESLPQLIKVSWTASLQDRCFQIRHLSHACKGFFLLSSVSPIWITPIGLKADSLCVPQNWYIIWTHLHACMYKGSFFFLIRVYSLYMGDSLWQFQMELYYTLFSSPPPSLPFDPLPATLKAIARGLFILFHISIWNPSTIHPHLNLFHSPSPPTRTPPLVPPPHTHTVPILQSCYEGTF